MPVRTDTGQYQRAWVLPDEAATADRLVRFGEWPLSLDGHEPMSVTVALTGSATGVELKGTASEVRQELDTLIEKEFSSGSVTLSYPEGNGPRKLALSLDFTLRKLSAALSRGSAEVADAAFETLRGMFPRSPSTPETEQERLAAREARIEVEQIRAQARQLAGDITAHAQMAESKLTSLAEVETRTGEIANQVGARRAEATQRLTEIASAKNEAAAAAAGVAELRNAAEATKGKIGEIHEATQNLLVATKELHAQANTATTETQARRDGATQALAEVKAGAAEVISNRKAVQESLNAVGALEAKIKQFHGEIAHNQEKLETLQQQASGAVGEYKATSEQVVAENRSLQAQIKEQLLQATGGALFGAFNERKGQIIRSKWIWAIASGLAILIQAAAVIWLAHEAKQVPFGEGSFYYQPMFILKATIAVPLIALIWFCIRQYGNEREVEELYAFKAALSFSLAPYLHLVEEMSAREKAVEETQFAIRTIGQIFENPHPPEPKEKRRARKDGVLTKEIIEKVIELAGTLRKLP